MKLATWNVNSLTVRLPQVLDWLLAQTAEGGMDVLALQETKTTDDKFPHQAFTDAGYHAEWFGQKTYNGVAILSRAAITPVATDIPSFTDEQRRVLAVDTAGLRIIDLYVPNGQEPGSEKFAYKMRWLEALHGWLAAERAGDRRGSRPRPIRGDAGIRRVDGNGVHRGVVQRREILSVLRPQPQQRKRAVHRTEC